MASRRGRRWRRAALAAAMLGLLVGLVPGMRQGGDYEPPRSLDDARLARLRRASADWELRAGPRREVVDVVCIVPDAATFFQALASWDEAHWFPILIEDVEYSAKFLRAFRPSRIVRYPRRAEAPANAERRWAAAVDAVGRSWTADDDDATPGDRPPGAIRRPPPGVVVSNPAAPMLTGAAALAAGRFQPIVRWEPGRRFDEVLTADEAQRLARDLEAAISHAAPNHDRLGDDCDFLTLALDCPYRYEGSGIAAEAGPAAFDDLIGRHLDVRRPDDVRLHWAFAGRLLGDEARSAYAAMCSLFLRPDRATLINAYGDAGGPPFGDYRHAPAAERLEGLMEVSRRDRDESDLSGWHAAFAPVNRAGLVLVNTSGNPDWFNLGGPTPGRTWDVPPSEPAAVYTVHSFSAANPNDPGTIAGRWLANGAFAYFGSAHEPYLQSFRPPELVADLLAEGVPFAAAARMLPEEVPAFGNCWRLAYLGDPLFRIDPGRPRNRLDRWAPLDRWPVYDAPDGPATPGDPFAVLAWAVKVALDAARRGEPSPGAMLDALRSIDRGAFDGPLRDYRDLLLADGFAQHDRLDLIRADLGRWPAATLSPAARRWLESARVASLQRALAADDWPTAAAIWEEVARSAPPPALLGSITERVGPPPGRGDRVDAWRRRLLAAKARLTDPEIAAVIDGELARIDETAG